MLIYQQFFLCSISAFTFQISFKGPWYFCSKTETSNCIRYSAAQKLSYFAGFYSRNIQCTISHEGAWTTGKPFVPQGHPPVDCKTVGFFLKISKEIGNAWRKSLMRANRASLTFSASFHTFCLTARAYLNTQKYGLFYSLTLPGPPCYCSHTEGQRDPGWEDMRLLVNDKHQTKGKPKGNSRIPWLENRGVWQ